MTETPSLVDTGTRGLPGTDLSVGPVAFGCWRFVDDDLTRAGLVLDTALDAGMTLVDCADVYGFDWGGAGFGANEEILGRLLAEDPSRRDRLVLATKGGINPGVPYDSSPGALRAACEASLRRLRVDVIDLYMVHRPDLLAHPAQVAETLSALRAEGKIRAIGVSNHTAAQHDALVAHLGEPLAASQPEFSAAHLDPLWDGVFDHCMARGTLPLAWSPLAGGRIVSGSNVSPALTDAMDAIAGREGVDRATVAIAFVLSHPSRPVAIVGTQSPARLRAMTSVGSVRLSRSDWYDLIEASTGVPLP